LRAAHHCKIVRAKSTLRQGASRVQNVQAVQKACLSPETVSQCHSAPQAQKLGFVTPGKSEMLRGVYLSFAEGVEMTPRFSSAPFAN
jgi:hypothetical protein